MGRGLVATEAVLALLVLSLSITAAALGSSPLLTSWTGRAFYPRASSEQPGIHLCVCNNLQSRTFFEVLPAPSELLAPGQATASVLGPPRPALFFLNPDRPQPLCQGCPGSRASWASSLLSSSHDLGNVGHSGGRGEPSCIC